MVATLPRSYGEGVRRQFINRKGHLSELTGVIFLSLRQRLSPCFVAMAARRHLENLGQAKKARIHIQVVRYLIAIP
jgi:hypothetical protein